MLDELTIALDPARAAAWAAGALAVVQALIKLGKTAVGAMWFERLGEHRTRVVWGLGILAAALSALVGGASALDALVVGLTVAGSAPAYDAVRATTKRKRRRKAAKIDGGETTPVAHGYARGEVLCSMLAVAIFAAAVAVAAACVTGADGKRRLDPRVALGADAACAVAQAACSAAGAGAPACAAVPLACGAWSSLRVAVGGGAGGEAVVWYCVAYDPADLENPESAMVCGERRCVCWTDPRVAAEAAAELDGEAEED